MQSIKSYMGIYPSRSASTDSTVPIPVPDSAEWSAVEEQVNQQLRRRRQNKADQTEAGNDAKPAEENTSEKPSEEKPSEENPSEEASKENQAENNESSGEDSDDECEDEEIDPKLMIAVFRRPKCERCAAVLDILLAPNEDDESSEEEEKEEEEVDTDTDTENEEEEERGVPSVITNLFIVIFLIHLMQLFIKMNEPVPRYVFY